MALSLLHARARSLARLLVLCLAGSAAAGCGDDVEAAPNGTSEGVGGGGAGGGGVGGAGGEPVPTTCDASAPASHPTCTGAACPITVDVELRCTDYNFAEYGVRVAPTPDAVSVAVASPDEVRVARVTGDSIETNLSPFESIPAPVLAVTGRDGAVAIAADETTIESSTTPPTYPGGLVFGSSTNGVEFTLEGVADNGDKYTPVVDLELAPDGSPFVFYAGFPGYALATRAAGTWIYTPIDAGDSGYGRFTLTSAGEIVVVTVAGANNDQLVAQIGTGSPFSLGAPLEEYSVRFRPAPPATGDLPAGAPEIAVAAQRQDGVSVLWPDAAGPEEVFVAGSETVIPTCAIGIGDATVECPTTPCAERAVGVTPDAYAMARTTDGAVVVAYVVTHLDYTVKYDDDCGEPPNTECYCTGNIENDVSTSELFVVRVAPGGAAQETILQLPVGRLVAGPNSTGHSALYAVDARAFGTDVAVAMRTLDADGKPAVRVLRLRGAR